MLKRPIDIKKLKSTDLIPFFIEYVKNHSYINSIHIAKTFLDKSSNTSFNLLSKNCKLSLTHKIIPLIRDATRIGILIRYNTKIFKVINKKKLLAFETLIKDVR
ncbi:hypothetical protein LCGC14_0506390 [marine sediment metagenome]|uniref:Uncharacterized protein n=1 Tax=marine sediment metagenome TaxID=412755 RepID=A0A0F9S7G0_9ZZZZ